MATLYVTEYTSLCKDASNRPMPVPKEPATAEQTVTFTTSTASNAFRGDTRVVRIVSDADAHIQFGDSPTATTSLQPIKADTEYFRGVVGGQKVAAVTA